MSQLSPREFYRREIPILEQLYHKNPSQSDVWKRFQQDLKKQFNLEIVFDIIFSQSFRDYFNVVVQTLSASEDFAKKIKWVKYLNKLMRDHKFVSKRDFDRIRSQIQSIEQSSSIQWLDQLTYLRSASSLLEFRGEFLSRICKIDNQTAEQLQEQIENNSKEAIQTLKKHYVSFFEQCLSQNSNKKIVSFLESEWASWEVKGQMLPLKLVTQLDRYLGVNQVGNSQNEVEINKALIETAQNNLYQNDRDVQQRLDNEVELIEKALEKFSGLNIIKDKKLSLHVAKFGSLISGFASTDADLDLTILTNCYVKEDQFLKVLQEFLQKEYKEGDRRSQGRKVTPNLTLTAKTPLITITIREQRKKEIKIDLIVNNILGVINSKFLSVYAKVRWVRNLGILVKLWGKAVNLIGKSQLSSYALILMLIHYLIRAKHVKPILDARNRSSEAPHFKFKRMKKEETQLFDVYYVFKNRAEDVTNVERVNYFKVLQGFFKFYGFDIWKEKEDQRIITVDQSITKQVDPETALTIKDPFDKPHNPGRLKIESKQSLISKFKDAHTILLYIKENPKLSTEVRQQKVRELFSK